MLHAPPASRSAEDVRATRLLCAIAVLAVLRLCAGAYEAWSQVALSARERRGFLLGQLSLSLLPLLALLFRARLPRRPAVHRALVLLFAALLCAAQVRVASPQLSLLMLVEAVLAVSALAASWRPGKALLYLYFALCGGFGALLLAELFATRALSGGAPDYGDLGLPPGAPRFGPGGQLAPDQDQDVVGDGPNGRVRFATDAHGFRRDRELSPAPAAGTFRILLAGDSFAAGYRVGQDECPGAALERALAPVQVEVAAARLDDPVYAWDWLERHGLAFQPHLVVLFATLANDAAGAWAHLHPAGEYELRGGALARRAAPPEVGFTTPPLAELYLPASAFERRGALALALRGTRDKLARLRVVSRLSPPDARTGSAAWYGDLPGRVHALDLMHGLGLYLARDAPPLVREAEQRLEQALAGAHAAAARRGVPLVVVPIPSRIEVDEADWSATVARYALDPAAFDRERPRRALARFLEQAGIASVDLAPAFRAAAARGERLFLPRGDMHWSARGATLAGETVADALSAAGLVR